KVTAEPATPLNAGVKEPPLVPPMVSVCTSLPVPSRTGSTAPSDVVISGRLALARAPAAEVTKFRTSFDTRGATGDAAAPKALVGAVWTFVAVVAGVVLL